MKLFVFVLLATLSIVNAIPFHKRATAFEKCPIETASPLTVKVTPDPLVAGETSKFDISGTLAVAPSEGSNLVVLFFDPDTKALVGVPTTSDICALTADCTATEFTTSLDVPVPKDLPEAYGILVAISNTAEENIQACSVAKVGDVAIDGLPPTK